VRAVGCTGNDDTRISRSSSHNSHRPSGSSWSRTATGRPL
jgi:hypothetical protein